MGPEIFDRLVIGCSNVPGRVHADGPVGLAELSQGPVEQSRERCEACSFAADDGDHEGETIPGGAHHRFRAAANADPGREMPRFRVGIYGLSGQGCPGIGKLSVWCSPIPK